MDVDKEQAVKMLNDLHPDDYTICLAMMQLEHVEQSYIELIRNLKYFNTHNGSGPFNNGTKIPCIRFIRSVLGLGLKEAKDYVETI